LQELQTGTKKGRRETRISPTILASTLPVSADHETQDAKSKQPDVPVTAVEKYTREVHAVSLAIGRTGYPL
jgi:hypothetical protein